MTTSLAVNLMEVPRPFAGPLTAEVLRDWDAVRQLAPEWNELLRQSDSDSIFLTWEWMSCWIDVHARTRPFVVAIRDADGRLAGLLPLYVARARLGRVWPFRVLRYVGDYASGQEYPDWIVRHDCAREAAHAIARALTAASREWDCLWIPRVAGWTGALDRMREACADAGFYWRHRPASFALATLPDSAERFLGSMSPRHRGDLRKKAKTILEREGVAVRQCTRPEDVGPVLEALFDLHEQRWMAVGDPGAFRRKPAEAEFYRRFARLAFDRGWLRLYGLAENGQLKAVQIGYVYGGVFHSVQEGFDPQYLSGVGNVLRLKVVEHCIDSGIHLMDHLGDMTEHKRRWQAVERGGWDVFIGHRSVRNRLMFTKEVWPTGRFFQWSDAGR